jgi:hypothetical protein
MIARPITFQILKSEHIHEPGNRWRFPGSSCSKGSSALSGRQIPNPFDRIQLDDRVRRMRRANSLWHLDVFSGERRRTAAALKGRTAMDWETRRKEVESQRDDALEVRLRLQPGPGSKPVDFMHLKNAIRAHEEAKERFRAFSEQRSKLDPNWRPN